MSTETAPMDLLAAYDASSEPRDRTVAALEHLDRVTFRYENASEFGLENPWVSAALVIARNVAKLSALQRAGIGKARVADLIRSGVLVPVMPP